MYSQDNIDIYTCSRHELIEYMLERERLCFESAQGYERTLGRNDKRTQTAYDEWHGVFSLCYSIGMWGKGF